VASPVRSRKPYLLFSTVGSQKNAEKIANILIRKELAACVNIIPKVHSFFKWRGAVDKAHELLLVIKTDFYHLKKVERTIRKYHSYEVPEIIGWPIAYGHKPYLTWLSSSLT